MNLPELRLTGAQVLTPDGMNDTALSLAGGLVVDGSGGRAVDLSGYLLLPGIIDLHGDGFERHLAPRRGMIKDLSQGVISTEAELAVNGITTACLAQFYSWEGGQRGPEFATRMMQAVARVRPQVSTDLRILLRFEAPMLKDYGAVEALIVAHDVNYVVFSDHLPHGALEQGKRPPRLTGQALKAGRSPEAHLAMLQNMHARRGEVPAALAALTARLMQRGVLLGSHDDPDAKTRRAWHAMGAGIAEFPETLPAAKEARTGGDRIILGAPNLVRGGSHKGNVSALDMVAAGLCDALASDYHYPSLRQAALLLASNGMFDLAKAWSLISTGPARVLGLHNRGELSPGKRADLVILDAETQQLCATIAGGQVRYMSGPVVTRFIG
ncbi:amidohydrolase 3 [hydrothermal vent metagenome]|uniref:Amidohydrolase 3 n=1 Tax=hydrothermal vent metagenome TaxID=652676 RepID=A0A3B0SCN3_9ZZZZ